MLVKLYGVPGGGKTTAIVSRLTQLIGSKEVDPEKVWAISLTRGTKEAFECACIDRELEITGGKVRTLHSIAWWVLKDKYNVRVIKDTELANFFSLHGYKYTSNGPGDYQGALSGDDPFEEEEAGNKLLAHFERLRLSYDLSISAEEHTRRYLKEHHPELVRILGLKFPEKFMQLFRKYLDYQKEIGAWDFTTFLIKFYKLAMKKEGVLPSGDVLILDEFQDFSPLAVRIVQKMFPRYKQVLIAGDDDQCIYQFAGASPQYLLELQADQEIVLDYSHRLPEKIAKVANMLISRNANRRQKYIKVGKRGGELESRKIRNAEQVLLDVLEGKKECLVLTRHRHMLRFWAIICEKFDIPYRFVKKPVEAPEFFDDMWMVKLLREGYIPKDEKLKELLGNLKPLIRKIEKVQRVKAERIEEIARELKQKRMWGGEHSEVVRAIYNYPIEELFSEGKGELVKKWVKRLDRREEWKRPKIKLATIHSAKGLEADTVVLDTGISKTVRSNLRARNEGETRVWYVALTRARERIIEVERAKGKSYTKTLGRFSRWTR